MNNLNLNKDLSHPSVGSLRIELNSSKGSSPHQYLSKILMVMWALLEVTTTTTNLSMKLLVARTWIQSVHLKNQLWGYLIINNLNQSLRRKSSHSLLIRSASISTSRKAIISCLAKQFLLAMALGLQLFNKWTIKLWGILLLWTTLTDIILSSI